MHMRENEWKEGDKWMDGWMIDYLREPGSTI